MSLVVMGRQHPMNCRCSRPGSPAHAELMLPLVREEPLGEQQGHVLLRPWPAAESVKSAGAEEVSWAPCPLGRCGGGEGGWMGRDTAALTS